MDTPFMTIHFVATKLGFISEYETLPNGFHHTRHHRSIRMAKPFSNYDEACIAGSVATKNSYRYSIYTSPCMENAHKQHKGVFLIASRNGFLMSCEVFEEVSKDRVFRETNDPSKAVIFNSFEEAEKAYERLCVNKPYYAILCPTFR